MVNERGDRPREAACTFNGFVAGRLTADLEKEACTFNGFVSGRLNAHLEKGMHIYRNSMSYYIFSILFVSCSICFSYFSVQDSSKII